MPLSLLEKTRYARHLNLEGIGEAGQEKLKSARVLSIGAGGLGSPFLLYLAAAGVGTLGIVDNDRVSLDNLPRQLLYKTADVSQLKVEAAQTSLLQTNPHLNIHPYPTRLTEENAQEIFSSYDIIAECSDNFDTKYLVNDTCLKLKKPNVFGSVSQFEGICSVFCLPNTPCYRCFNPSPPKPHLIPNSQEAGIFSVLPGLIGVIQAIETIKLILSIGETLIGKLLTVHTLTMRFQTFRINFSECVH